MVDIRSVVALFPFVSISLVGASSFARTIPTELRADPDSSPYIQPTCSKCIKNVQSDSASTAVLELTYFDEDHGDFAGSIELTVLLADGSEDVISIEDVSLHEDQEAGWVLEAPAEWDWDAVDRIELELLPQ